MAVAVIFPKLDEAMTSGKIVRWLKNEGDRVEKGEIILEIESEKTSFELEAETSGILSNITYQAGDEVPIGTTIAYILKPGEKAPEAEAPVTVKAKAEAPEPEAKAEAARPAGELKEFKASPLARNIAKEHNVDLSLVTGTGPGGRITKEDVLKHIEEGKAAAPPAGAAGETVPLSTMR